MLLNLPAKSAGWQPALSISNKMDRLLLESGCGDWGVGKCPLFGGHFVLGRACADFVVVRCPEQRSGFSEVSFVLGAC